MKIYIGKGANKIITAGIDAGMQNTKVVIITGMGGPFWVVTPGGTRSAEQVAQNALAQTIEKAGISRSNIDYIISTGVGSGFISTANKEIPEFMCLAKGIDHLLPTTRTLLDLGARKSLAIICQNGKATKFVTSSKCAAGSGTFLEIVIKILGIGLDRMNELYFKSITNLEVQSTCAIFAESEIISLIHAGNKSEDIIRGVFTGLAARIYPQLLGIGIEKDVAVVGGVAKSQAMIAALEELIGFRVNVPPMPEIVGAFGAALIAQQSGVMS